MAAPGSSPAAAAAGCALVACAVALIAACAPLASTPQASALTRERIAAIVASPDRSPADRNNDVRRKPVDLLAFVDPRPGMTVLDVSAGGGYTTELLARAVGPAGRVYGQSAPRDPGRAGLRRRRAARPLRRRRRPRHGRRRAHRRWRWPNARRSRPHRTSSR